MDNPDITMEEYIKYETEKALITIVYNDALKSESKSSAEPTNHFLDPKPMIADQSLAMISHKWPYASGTSYPSPSSAACRSSIGQPPPALVNHLLSVSLLIWLGKHDTVERIPSVKAITLPQDVPSTSDRHLIKIENQVQRLMEAHLALTQPTQVNKITNLCEICSGPHDTQYCMEDPKQAFVEYASSHIDEARVLVPQSFDTEVICTKGDDGEVMFIKLIRKNDDSSKGEPGEEGKDIISIIEPRLSQVVIGKPFVEITNMTHDPHEGIVRFTNRTDEVAYKMPHMIEQYNSLSDLEKEHTKSVYLRNKEDKKRE
nr:retrotransposon Orf1 [Tanacetum cinerariifolium]